MHLKKVEGVTDCIRLQGDGKPDISLRWKGSEPILVECKNVLHATYAGGIPKLDFQRTRGGEVRPVLALLHAERLRGSCCMPCIP